MKCLEFFFLITLLVCIPNVKSQSLDKFVLMSNASIHAPSERWGEIVDEERCADECLKRIHCHSFEMESGKCFLSKYVSSHDYRPKKNTQRDFYQRIDPNEEYIPMKYSSIHRKDDLGRMKDQTLAECQEHCRTNPNCHSFEAKLICTSCKRFKCDFSTASHLTDNVTPSIYDWDIYLLNPDYSKRCSAPASIKYAKMNVFDLEGKSKVMYNCFHREDKAHGKEAKSNMSAEYCIGPVLNHFVLMSNVSLDAPKERWGEIVDEQKCADECIKRILCRSFEMESGKCFLSIYVTSDDHRPIKNKQRDFYQRIDPNQEYIAMKHSSIHRKDDLGRKKDQTLDECQEHCRTNPNCHSFETKLMCASCKRFKCDFSTANHLTDNITLSTYGWDIYLLNPNHNLDCIKLDPMKYANLNLFDANLDSVAKYTCVPGENATGAEFENATDNADEKNDDLATPANTCTDPFPYSCAKIKECVFIRTDRETIISPKIVKGRKVSVFCEGMSTDNPKEYITLKKPTYFEVPVISDTTSCTDIEWRGRMRYDKVRFLPEEMALDVNDQKFTTFEPLPPGKKMCLSKQNFTIDLRQTDFIISEKENWVTSGVSANITSVQKSEGDQLAVVTCSGKCGICKSVNPFPVGTLVNF